VVTAEELAIKAASKHVVNLKHKEREAKLVQEDLDAKELRRQKRRAARAAKEKKAAESDKVKRKDKGADNGQKAASSPESSKSRSQLDNERKTTDSDQKDGPAPAVSGFNRSEEIVHIELRVSDSGMG